MTKWQPTSRLVTTLALAAASAIAGAAPAIAIPESAYAGLRWRLLGPFRAGWSTCAEGVPKSEVFYFGAADGGVWKTDDAGHTWVSLFDHETAASVGALALAPSHPEVIYVGTGQVAMRYDVTAGNGVYRSADGGRTWSHAGLDDTRHIGRILVDPRDPDVALVAALGHVFGPNPERGVFRTTDGGRTWDKTLYKDADTGAVDLASDPAQPDVVFAALWQVRRHPWLDYFMPTSGPGSGIYKSQDAGRTWMPVPGAGLPAGPLGRIGLALAPGTLGQRVYATIEAQAGAGLYRSDDGGARWEHVNDDLSLASSYFGRLTVDPRQADTLYVMGRSVQRSTDGGRTFTVTKGAPGGDDPHFMWIDPTAPERMILAGDQGTTISLNGGRTWSSWYNQPTGQFYRLGADERFPYRVYSSQQDSGTVSIASRSDYGQLTFRDWHPVGGDERDVSLPDPEDPDTVYVSGLGGRLSRFDARTGRVANVSPWPVGTYARRPTTVRYRYTWITPLAISPVAPHALYQGAQVLFRSLDHGRTWETISPDLSGARPDARDCDGDVPVERARACGFGVIHAIAPSPLERDQVWVGTDDGLIQLTRDGGKSWRDVTPPGLAEWSKIAAIDASPHDAGTAYAAVDRHRLDDFAPHVWRTHDHGRTWSERNEGLPAGAFVNVVRQDPVEPRLLYAGTSRGVFVSFDDGDHWQPLQAGLPTTGVNDLLVHGHDLLAATQGRALWALDDVSPLRQLGRAPLDAAAFLFAPAAAVRVGANEYRDTPLPREEPTAANPPAGAALDYHLGSAPAGAVMLEVFDARGERVRRWSNDEPPERPRAERYFEEAWLQPLVTPGAQRGHHRLHWDLRHERPRALEYEYGIAATPGLGTPALPQGMLVAPGRYDVRLTVGGQTFTRPLTVEPDPRVPLAAADAEAQRGLYRDAQQALARAAAALEEIDALLARLRTLAEPAASGRRATRAAAARLADGLERLRHTRSDDGLDAIRGALASQAIDLESADGPPSAPQQQVVAHLRERLEAALGLWESWRKQHGSGIERLLGPEGR